ncbi:B12-binding domain-containing radical SAM protein, partial [Patescibacteria group bacterium]|nr:B12-binding domain-containing radical SAM protein [Patescibacteria group bacterium]
INRCKSFGKTVVAGGPAFTAQAEKFSGVDHFVLNEAEITLPLFLNDLQEGMPMPVYTSTKRPDITKTPIPLWSLINFKDYVTMAVQYSRGCPFNCEFCDIIILNGRIPRVKREKRFINEIQSLYNAGWRGSIFIVDDNFIGNKTQVKKMLALLIEWQKKLNYPFKFFTEASVNMADDEELMQLMSKANFYKVFIGIETPHIDSLQECGKTQNIATNLIEAVKTIQLNGMQVMAGFIVGFDNDPPNIFDAQIKFIREVGVVTAMVGLLNALPGTRLWHRLQAESRLVGDTKGENTDGSLNFIPKMGEYRLREGYKKILSEIYSYKQYYRRIDKFIKNYKPTVKVKITTLDGAKAFVKSIFKIGFSRAGLLYWKLIFKTSFTKIRALPEAVELAIMGLHFKKIADKITKA